MKNIKTFAFVFVVQKLMFKFSSCKSIVFRKTAGAYIEAVGGSEDPLGGDHGCPAEQVC